MTEEEKKKFEEDLRKSIQTEYETKLAEKNKELADKEAKRQEILTALHQARQKNKALKGKKPNDDDDSTDDDSTDNTDDDKKIDEEAIKTIATSVSRQTVLESQIRNRITEISRDTEEAKLIEANFNRLRGTETNPDKLEEILTDAKLLANKTRLLNGNPLGRMGSSTGGRLNTQNDDSGTAKKMGSVFGLSDKDYENASKPIKF